jgi:hypothetical protein
LGPRYAVAIPEFQLGRTADPNDDRVLGALSLLVVGLGGPLGGQHECQGSEASNAGAQLRPWRRAATRT